MRRTGHDNSGRIRVSSWYTLLAVDRVTVMTNPPDVSPSTLLNDGGC
jgi:hypothetical protein